MRSDKMKDDIYFSDRENNRDRYVDIDSGRFETEYEDIYSDSERDPRRKSGGNPGRNQGSRPSNQPQKRKKKKKRSGCGCLTGILAFLLAVCVCVSFLGYRVINGLFDNVTYDEKIHSNVFITDDNLYKNEEVTNILFIGVDRRENKEASRSDTMMLFTIDRVNEKIKLTSFMRDMWVDIPGEGYAKINSSCMWGGPQLVMDTIEYNFKVDVDNYVLVDFEMFTKIVDGLGGVSVEVTEKEAAYFGSGKLYAPPMKIEAGTPLLTGEEALWYCRIRYLDDDFHRTQRQRKMISAIINKAKQTNITDLVKIAKEVMPFIETGIPQEELVSLAFGAAFSFLKYDIEQLSVPAEGTWSYGTKKGMSVILTDVEKNQQALYDFIYTVDEDESVSESEKAE